MQPNITQVLAWVDYAGKIALQLQKEDLQITHKSNADLVTRADKTIEAYLMSEIQITFPDHSINAEESGLDQQNMDHQWFIDPIDGTLNYAHGLPLYAISIAYAYKGEIQLGVISSPALNEVFSAVKGECARLNGQAMHVSKIETMIDAMLITGFRHQFIDTPRSNINNFIRLSREVQTIRRLGSAALNLAYVAAGRADGFWEIALNPWDVAAGILLVKEAGGMVEPLYETENLLSGSVNMLAGNATIFPQIKSILLDEYEKTTSYNQSYLTGLVSK